MSLNINQLVQKMLENKKQGDTASLIGVGPVSFNVMQASLEVAKELNFPMMFIASRNQVDLDEFGGGYANGWDQERFAKDIKEMADKVGYDKEYYLCRDHGGPWQRDKERNDHLEEELAMSIAKKSYLADMESGFHLLMIDPTKDPFEMGKVIPLETVINRTVELIEYCETERKALNLPEIGYEVGTEETNGGLTSTEKYREFIEKLGVLLKAKNLPMPTFIVGQTGTLTRKTEQAGKFNYESAVSLSEMAAEYSVGLKEHNGDYFDDATLLEHIPAGVTGVNVAPQYGTEETRALINLVEVEERLNSYGLIKEVSNLQQKLTVKAIETERWRKWMDNKWGKASVEEVLEDKDVSFEILEIAGHYVFNDPEIKDALDVLYSNLNEHGIDGHRYVINHIKKPIENYAKNLNLVNLFDRV